MINPNKIDRYFADIFGWIKDWLSCGCHISGETGGDEGERDDRSDGYLIPIDPLFPLFEEHIGEETNTRILFSGKYGIGKTFFLNAFFGSPNRKDKYFVVHLHPTNYQISGNEKIIEYIKTDILMHIFHKKSRITESVNKVHKKVIANKWYQIAVSAGNGIPVARDFVNAIDGIIKKTGIITEKDIKKQLEGVEKTKVLIIDDLDRLDPEHIFRILNVFSSFVGEDENEKEIESNRLGFDKVICVCDFANLRNLFSHKYGEKVDFEGYINKYFSHHVYVYDSEEAKKIFSDSLGKIVSSYKVSEQNAQSFTVVDNTVINASYFSYLVLKTLRLGLQLKSRHVDLRILLKAARHNLPVLQHSISSNMRVDMMQRRLINQSINALKVIFGDKETLINCIEGIISEYRDLNDDESVQDLNSGFAGHLFNCLQETNNIDATRIPGNPQSASETDYELFLEGANSRMKVCVDTSENNVTRLFIVNGNKKRPIPTVMLYRMLLLYLENNLEEK